MKIFFLGLLLIVSVNLSAQQFPSLSFQQNSLGGPASDIFTAVIESSDGHYVFAGFVESSGGNVRGWHGGRDFWVVKLNGITGDTIWTSMALGGTGDEYVHTVFEVNNGDYLIAGTTTSSDGNVRGWHGSRDLWAVKLNGITGDTIWTSRALGGSKDESSYSGTAFQSSDGNYVLAGFTESLDGDVRGWHVGGSCGISAPCYDFWAVKLNATTGDTIWTSRALGGSGLEDLFSAFESSDGHCILAGRTQSPNGDVRAWHGDYDFWVVKLNGITGDTIWTSRALGGSGYDKLNTAFESSDGYYVLAGTTSSPDGDVRGWHGGQDLWAVKLSGITGDTIWTTRALGGTGDDLADIAFEMSGGNYILAGTTSSPNGDVRGWHGGLDFWILKLNNTTGDTILMSSAIGGNNKEELFQIKPTCDGGFLISGDTYTLVADGDVSQSSYPGSTESLWMLKTDNLFNIEWDKVWSDGSSVDAENGLAYLANDGGYLFIGQSRQTAIVGDKTVIGHGDYDIWTAKIYWIDAAFESDTVCAGISTAFVDSTKGLASALSGVTWFWNFGDPTTTNDTSTLQNPKYTYQDSGTYLVTQIVHKECQWDTFVSTVLVFPNPTVDAGTDTVICNVGDNILLGGDPTALSGTPGYTYVWDNGAGNIPNPIVAPVLTTRYRVTVTDTNNCLGLDSILVSLELPLSTSYSLDDTICVGESIKLWAEGLLGGQPGGVQYVWSPAMGLSNPLIDSPLSMPTSTITYRVIISSQCKSDTDSVTITVNSLPLLSVNPIDTTIKAGSPVKIIVLGANSYMWSPSDYLQNSIDSVQVLTPNDDIVYTIVGTDMNGCTQTIVSTIRVIEDMFIYIPNALSANGDGNNDGFKIRGEGFKLVSLQIYDRWGHKVFDGNASNDTWIPIKDNLGVYVYRYELERNDNGNLIEGKGNVTLIR